MHLSDVFKYIHSFGQKGHQIGRKIGDAVELLVYGMIKEDEGLSRHLRVERGLEGATTAKHKVEFAFYQFGKNETPTEKIDDLFGFIECKKVGVEVTIKQSFKNWKEGKRKFHETGGYSFTLDPNGGTHKRTINLVDSSNGKGTFLQVTVSALQKATRAIKEVFNDAIAVNEKDSILFALDTNHEFHLIQGQGRLFDINGSLMDCVICKIEKIENGKISAISINECLTGPQTPEKAKQASFVSLDVRKKVLGRFDKTSEDDRLISILVLAEASHWDPKSRAMIRLCNDYNLVIPDKVIIQFFRRFEEEFGENYQSLITKSALEDNDKVSALVKEIINHFDLKILADMDSETFFRPTIEYVAGQSARLRLVEV